MPTKIGHKNGLLLIILLLLSSCGFHLRGLAEIPDWLNNIAVVVDSGSRELEPLLDEQLKSYHVNVFASKAKAQYWLVIENDFFQKQITNVSASTTPRQYLLLNTVSVTRQFTLNNDRILGSDYEEMTFKREMEREASSLIISRLSAAHQNTNYAH